MTNVRDLLHDAIDAMETSRATARDEVRKLWAERLPAILREADGTGDPDAPAGDLVEALKVLVGEVAVALDPVTSKAIRNGAEIGKKLRNGDR